MAAAVPHGRQMDAILKHAAAAEWSLVLEALRVLAPVADKVALSSFTLERVGGLVEAAEAAVEPPPAGADVEESKGDAEGTAGGGSKGPVLVRPNEEERNEIGRLSLTILAAWLTLVAAYKRSASSSSLANPSTSRLAPAAQVLVDRARKSAMSCLDAEAPAPLSMPARIAGLLALAVAIELAPHGQPKLLESSTEAAISLLRGCHDEGGALSEEDGHRLMAGWANFVTHVEGSLVRDMVDAALRVFQVKDVKGQARAGSRGSPGIDDKVHGHMRSIMHSFEAAARTGVLDLSGKPLALAKQQQWVKDLSEGAHGDAEEGCYVGRMYAAGGILRASSVASSAAIKRSPETLDKLKEMVMCGVRRHCWTDVNEEVPEGLEEDGLVWGETAVHVAIVVCLCCRAMGTSYSGTMTRVLTVFLCRVVLGEDPGGEEAHLKQTARTLFVDAASASKADASHSGGDGVVEGAGLATPSASSKEASDVVAFVASHMCHMALWASGNGSSSSPPSPELTTACAESFCTVMAMCVSIVRVEDTERIIEAGARISSANKAKSRMMTKLTGQLCKALAGRVSREDKAVYAVQRMVTRALTAFEPEEGSSSAVVAASSGGGGGDVASKGQGGGGGDVDSKQAGGESWAKDLESTMWVEDDEAGVGDDADGWNLQGGSLMKEALAGSFLLRICSQEPIVAGARLTEGVHLGLMEKVLYLSLRLVKILPISESDSAHDLVRALLSSSKPRILTMSLSSFPPYWALALQRYPRACPLRSLVACLVALFRSTDAAGLSVASLPPSAEQPQGHMQREQSSDAPVPAQGYVEAREGRLAIVSWALDSLSQTAVEKKLLKMSRLLAALIPHTPIECLDPVLVGVQRCVDDMPKHQSAAYLNFVFSVVSSRLDFVRRPHVMAWYLRMRNKAGFHTQMSKL